MLSKQALTCAKGMNSEFDGGLTAGGRFESSGGRSLGSSSVGYVEKMNWGVWFHFHSVDCKTVSSRFSREK